MFRMIGMFLLIAVCIFLGINYFLAPMFPAIRQVVPFGLNIYNALGLAAIVVFAMILFGKKL